MSSEPEGPPAVKAGSTYSLGLMVRDLSGSELNWRLVTQANQRVGAGHDTIFFFEELLPTPLHPLGAAMQVAECHGFKGVAIATTLSTASKLAQFPGPAAKVFYLWDLEWVRFADRGFHAMRAVYGDESLRLVCRTEEHRRVVEDLWNRPVAGVVADADLDGLMEIARVAG